VLERMAARYGTRPSEFLELDGWSAYCLDEALFYRHMQQEVERAKRRPRGSRA